MATLRLIVGTVDVQVTTDDASAAQILTDFADANELQGTVNERALGVLIELAGYMLRVANEYQIQVQSRDAIQQIREEVSSRTWG